MCFLVLSKHDKPIKMSKNTATRSGKMRATEGDSSLRLEALEGSVQELNEKLALLMKKYPMDRDRMEALVLDAVGSTLDAHADAIEKLSRKQSQRTTTEMETLPEGIKKEIESLREEIKAVRDSVKAQMEAIWREMSSMKATMKELKKNPLSDEEEDGDIPRKSIERRSGRSRSTRKGRSRSSRRNARKLVESDKSESESDQADTQSTEEESDGEEFIADDGCRAALKISTYRLKDKNPKRDTRLKTVKVLADLKHLFDGDRFNGDDPLTVLHFLEELKTVFDDASICEGDARHMFRYFLTGDALRLFKGLTAKERDTYPQIVRWMLRTYVRENLLQEARDEFFARSQKSEETEQEYAEALRELSRRCVGMLSEKEVRTRFVRGLIPAIRTHVSGKIRRHTTWADAISIAADFGNAERETRKAERKREDRNMAPLSRRKPRMNPGALILRQPVGEDDSDGQLAAIAGAQDEGEVIGNDPVGALPWGGNPISRDTSFGSYRSSGSSSAQYHTPRSHVYPAPPTVEDNRRVMLPPGVPFPARKREEGSTQPCLGCGKQGHWIVDCKTTNPETRELILEALRARKAKRAANISGQPTRFRPVQRSLAILDRKDPPPQEQTQEDGEVENRETDG